MSGDRTTESRAPLGESPAARLERVIGRVLRAGVMVSTVCLSVGLLLSLASGGGAASGVLLNAGIIVLLATPVARVIISTIQYIHDRDWQFATLTIIVLLELAASAVAALVFNRRA